jgi:long-chain acyl-CoA synthetase
MLLGRVLAAVERHPDAVALVAGDQVVTYRHLRALVARAVGHLRQQGIAAGDTVGLAMGQSPLYPIVFLALGWIGALVVPVPPALRARDRDELLRKYRITSLVSERLEVVPAGCRLVQIAGIGARGDETMIDAGEPGFEPDTPLRIALTTGTTGMPKGVLQTHASFVDRVDRMHCDVAAFPRVLPPALHITIALNLVMHALARGGAVVFPRTYGNADFFDAIRRHGVTHVTAPPANLALMLAELPDTGPAFPGVTHLRLVGSTPTRAVLDVARRRFSPHIYVPYGLGEVGVVSMATPEMLLDDPTSVGALEPGVRLELADDGEVRVAIPGMPGDYWGPDAGQRTRFRDGWFHPGDRGRLSGGKLYIEGRIDHIINTGGRKVSPEYVEAILMEFPGVREAAAYPFDDGAGGTLLGAAIVAAPSLDREALRTYALERLHVMAPARYVEVASLPRNAMGKLERDTVKNKWGQSQLNLS